MQRARGRCRVGAGLIAALALSGCLPKKRPQPAVFASVTKPPPGQSAVKPSCLGIVDGKETAQFPFVGLLITPGETPGDYSSCTGTFVSDNTMVTASHCLRKTGANGPVYVPGPGFTIDGVEAYNKVMATAIKPLKLLAGSPSIVAGTAESLTDADIEKDVAVLIFPPHTAPAFAALADADARVGDAATVVGYGATAYEPDVNDPLVTRRFGFNQISEANAATLGIVGGDGKADSTVASKGDSGGPLLVEGKLIGALSVRGHVVDSTGPTGIFDTYVNLRGPAAQKLFADARASGAVFSTAGAPATGSADALAGAARSGCAPTPAAAGAELDGTWKTDCLAQKNDLGQITGYSQGTEAFAANAFTALIASYGKDDAACATPELEISITGFVKYGDPVATPPGARALDMTPAKVEETLGTDDAVTAANSAKLCGQTGWQKGVRKNVTAAVCGSPSDPQLSDPVFDVYRVEADGRLVSGDTTDPKVGRSAGSRPTAYDKVQVYRRQ